MRLLLALCLAVVALPATAKADSQQPLQVVGRREHVGQHRRAARREPRAGTQRDRQSVDRPAQLRADAFRRPHARRREDRDRQRDRLRHLGLAAPRRRRRRPHDRLGRRRARPRERRQPPPVVLAARRYGRSPPRSPRRTSTPTRAGARYFTARKRWFETKALARYNALRAEIHRRFAGVPVGYSESIFEPLGASLGLRLLTPPGFRQGGRGGRRGEHPRQGDGRAAASPARGEGVGVQQPERHSRGLRRRTTSRVPRTSRWRP